MERGTRPMGRRRVSGWRDYWNRPVRLLVNARHRTVHYARVADDILDELPPGDAAAVLDYGCGEALEAGRVAARCRRLFLCDAAPAIRAGLEMNFSHVRNVTVVAPEAVDAIADASLDLIVVNSVLQYLSVAECAALCRQFHRKLSADGRLVLADVIPPDAGFFADVGALLGMAVRHRFLLAALAGLAATFASEYRRLRRAVGLSTWTESAFVDLLGGCGFAAVRRPQNFGFNRRRMTFIARPLRPA